jgi:hypothetical protein
VLPDLPCSVCAVPSSVGSLVAIIVVFGFIYSYGVCSFLGRTEFTGHWTPWAWYYHFSLFWVFTVFVGSLCVAFLGRITLEWVLA